MSRDDGFDVADVSTGLLDDTKVKALWRALGDQARMTHAMTLYTATLLASWRHGCRVTVAEATPIWLTPDADIIAALQDARLLDKTQRLPVRAWNGWFGPAAARRDTLRARWNRANARRPRGNRAVTAPEPLRPSGPSGPSVPSDRTVLPARPRETTPSKDGGARNGRLAELMSPEALAAIGRKP